MTIGYMNHRIRLTASPIEQWPTIGRTGRPERSESHAPPQRVNAALTMNETIRLDAGFEIEHRCNLSCRSILWNSLISNVPISVQVDDAVDCWEPPYQTWTMNSDDQKK